MNQWQNNAFMEVGMLSNTHLLCAWQPQCEMHLINFVYLLLDALDMMGLYIFKFFIYTFDRLKNRQCKGHNNIWRLCVCVCTCPYALWP